MYNTLDSCIFESNGSINRTSNNILTSGGAAKSENNANDIAAVLTLSSSQRAASAPTTLKVGKKGDAVTKLQENLKNLGYNIKVDGIFGKDTENVVKKFQKAKGLKADGIVGEKTKKAIKKALEDKKVKTPIKNTQIQKMLDNIKNDKSLGLSKEKKTALTMAAERLLKENYEVAFVAGVLGNIMNEGTPGKFESSNYKSNPAAEPPYLKYMDNHFDYKNKFSGKSIREVGIIQKAINQQQMNALKRKLILWQTN